MAQAKLAAATRLRLEATGWYVRMLWQPPWLFPDDGRKLKRCSVPTDPWFAYLSDDPEPLADGRTIQGEGATADAAVLAAIPYDLRAAMARLEIELDNLRDCLQK